MSERRILGETWEIMEIVKRIEKLVESMKEDIKKLENKK
jgi:hypothetical protein